ncbi:hypothetical protein KAH94_04640 [bacterium]|nr:hypothetical protein [bacterium]
MSKIEKLEQNIKNFLAKNNIIKKEIKIPYDETNMRRQKINQTVDVLTITMELTIKYLEENYDIKPKKEIKKCLK